jgi:hypothetical protein
MIEKLLKHIYRHILHRISEEELILRLMKLCYENMVENLLSGWVMKYLVEFECRE